MRAMNRGVQIPSARSPRHFFFFAGAPNMFVSSEWNVMLPLLRQEF